MTSLINKAYTFADVAKEIEDQMADDGRKLERLIVTRAQFRCLLGEFRLRWPHIPVPEAAVSIQVTHKFGFDCLIVLGP